MRVAVLSDIHANAHALEAVGKEIGDARVDEVWCLGDVVGYGGRPREVLAWVRERAAFAVKGNHDHAVASGDTSGFNPIAAAAARYHAQLLDPAERAWLHDLPETAAPQGPQGRTLLVHASPDDHLHEYVLPATARARLPEWRELAGLLMLGHTHVPFAASLIPGEGGRRKAEGERRAGVGGAGPWRAVGFREHGEEAAREDDHDPRAILVVNPGSVGQPRDGDPRASFVTVDVDARVVELHRVAYDVDAAAMAIRQAKLDPFLAQRLYRGV